MTVDRVDLPDVVFQSPLLILPELKFGTVTFQLTVILKHTSLLGVLNLDKTSSENLRILISVLLHVHIVKLQKKETN